MATITVVKSGKTYKGTAKADIINVISSAGSNITVKALGGNDRITVKGGKNLVIDADKGNDTIVVSAGAVKSVALGAGMNNITVSDGVVSRITGGSGNDTVTVAKQKTLNINAGDGDNTIKITGINDSTTASAVSKGTITTGSGTDNITVNKGGFYKISTGEGKDTVKINGGSHITKTGAGKDTVTINSSRANYLDAGSGNDIITLKGSDSYNKVVGGAGNDIFHINNTRLNLFEGGTGDDTYNVSSLYGETVIDNSTAGKKDKDVLNIKGNINQVYDLAYDKKRDILMCNELYIRGFSKFSRVTLSDGSSKYSGSAKEIIKLAYSFDLSGVNTEIAAYNKNLNTIINKGFTTDYLASSAGYIKK